MNTTTKAETIQPEELARRRERYNRVRLVRHLSKWATKLDSLANDAYKLKRDGVPVPVDWGLDYDAAAELLNACRRYIADVLGRATATGKAVRSFVGYVVENYVRDGLDEEKLARLIDGGLFDHLGHARATLHANVEYVLKRAKAKADGGCNFFDLMPGGAEPLGDDELRPVAEKR